MQVRNRDADIEIGCVGMGGEGGGRNGEIGIDMYALPCVKQIASRNELYSAGSSALSSVVT